MTGIQIAKDWSYQKLMNIISDRLKIQNEEFEMQISYQVKENYPALEIQDDSTLLFYTQLKSTESDHTKFSLCIKLKKRENNNTFFTSTPRATISQSDQQSTSTNNMEFVSDIIHFANQL